MTSQFIKLLLLQKVEVHFMEWHGLESKPILRKNNHFQLNEILAALTNRVINKRNRFNFDIMSSAVKMKAMFWNRKLSSSAWSIWHWNIGKLRWLYSRTCNMPSSCSYTAAHQLRHEREFNYLMKIIIFVFSLLQFPLSCWSTHLTISWPMMSILKMRRW